MLAAPRFPSWHIIMSILCLSISVSLFLFQVIIFFYSQLVIIARVNSATSNLQILSSRVECRHGCGRASLEQASLERVWTLDFPGFSSFAALLAHNRRQFFLASSIPSCHASLISFLSSHFVVLGPADVKPLGLAASCTCYNPDPSTNLTAVNLGQSRNSHDPVRIMLN